MGINVRNVSERGVNEIDPIFDLAPHNDNNMQTYIFLNTFLARGTIDFIYSLHSVFEKIK